jgi:hypothetical protein
MNPEQIQQEISMIKEMIEKTRKETAESGHFLIFMGIAAVFFVLIVSLLEIFHLHAMVLPTMIILTLINAVIGGIIVNRGEKQEKVKSYPRTLVLTIWFISSMALVLYTFVFPFLNVFTFAALPVLVSVTAGIAMFMTGVIYELAYIRWLSAAWWISAVLTALTQNKYRFLIIIAAIIIGWILPGIILNRQYKNRSK